MNTGTTTEERWTYVLFRLLPLSQRFFHPRLEALFPHNVRIPQPPLPRERGQDFQRLPRVALEQLVRVRGNMRKREHLPAAPREVRERAGELEAEQRPLPRVVEHFVAVRRPKRHVARHERTRCELEQRWVQRVCYRQRREFREEGAELFVCDMWVRCGKWVQAKVNVRVIREPWRTEQTTLATSRMRRFCSPSALFTVSENCLTMVSEMGENCSGPLQ